MEHQCWSRAFPVCVKGPLNISWFSHAKCQENTLVTYRVCGEHLKKCVVFKCRIQEILFYSVSLYIRVFFTKLRCSLKHFAPFSFPKTRWTKQQTKLTCYWSLVYRVGFSLVTHFMYALTHLAHNLPGWLINTPSVIPLHFWVCFIFHR